MVIKNFFLAILILLADNILAQQRCSTFTLIGTVNVDTGRIELMSIVDNYYPYRKYIDTNIVNGKFTFTDSIKYPTPYRLGIRTSLGWSYLSGIFYVDGCSQTISCDTDSFRKMPNIRNAVMNEWSEKFVGRFKAVNDSYDSVMDMQDSLNKVYKRKIPGEYVKYIEMQKDSLDDKGDRVLLQYAKEYPESYLAMWGLVLNLRGNYRPIFDTIYDQLSTSVRKTFAGLELRKRLNEARNLAIGAPFPKIQVKDLQNKTMTIPKVEKGSKYTLVDFWFSHCGPCLKQFSTYKKLYAIYKNSGFEIIGISVDKVNDTMDWKKVIDQKQLDWPQYWDEENKNADRFSLSYFPQNFLLDANGIIIKRNLSPKELEKILADK